MNNEIYEKAIKWALSDDTGISSKALCGHMLRFEPSGNWPLSHSAPSDADDRGRCIRLLNLIPEWWARLGEMIDISESWKEQVLLIRKDRYANE